LRQLLLEIGCEEIPAGFMPGALRALEDATARALEAARLPFEMVRAVGTPRRLAVMCSRVAKDQEDQVVEVKGPPEAAAFDTRGVPTRAAEGFARSQGVGVGDLVVKELAQGRYVFALRQEKGRGALEVLPGVLASIVEQVEFPKSMRWGRGEFRFARPIRWLVGMFGSDTVDFQVANLRAGNLSRGHRFLYPEPFPLNSAQDYPEALRQRGVIVDQDERMAAILRGVASAAREAGGRPRVDEDLLGEVAYLVENPVAFWGSFDPSYLTLPEEVLVTCMKHHQKYFPVEAGDGGLLPRFVALRNGGTEGLELVRIGNERVLRARLADARFFFEEDSRTTLEERVPELDRVTFQETLGSMGDKARRLQGLVGDLGARAGLDEGTLDRARRAAMLCKADLVTHMVVEFPELQGVMGREYGLRSGEDPRVATAIFEHHLPRFSGDLAPRSREGALLALADKLDTVVGCFLAGIQPTGSSDPYGLRRQALGVVLCLLESGLRVSLEGSLEAALGSYPGSRELPEGIKEFFTQRLRGIMVEKRLQHEVIEAVLAREAGYLPGTLSMAEALDVFVRGQRGEDLLTAYRRSANLAAKAGSIEADPALFRSASEGELHEALARVTGQARRARESGDWDAYFSALSSLRGPVDRFLDDVLVMEPDTQIRENRLGLLKGVASLLGESADLGKIHMEGSSGQKE
jgi:glycyl-tRNA synthetase beta chain